MTRISLAIDNGNEGSNGAGPAGSADQDAAYWSVQVDRSADELSLCRLADEGVLETPPLQTMRGRRIVCHPKDWSDHVTVLCEGWAAASIFLADGRRQILSFLLPGDIVSAAAIFQPAAGRSVEAVTDVKFCRFSRDEVKRAILRDAALFERLAHSWAREQDYADQLAVDLGRRSGAERIARQMLYLRRRLDRRGLVQDDTMFFPLRRRHMCDATGLTPVHVTQVLSEMQRDGVFAFSGRGLIIRRLEDLRGSHMGTVPRSLRF